jgi:thiamine-phosphate pyrophosphorylase
MVWGRSCHSVDDVARAAADGAGYVTLSPVFASASKPGYGPPLGADALTRAASAVGDGSSEAASVPSIYALGGITPENTSGCVVAGATGVAVMGGVMAAPDPDAAVAAYLAELAVSVPRPESGLGSSGRTEERQ